MGYRLNRLDEPVFMAWPKPILTEFGIHQRLESCEALSSIAKLALLNGWLSTYYLISVELIPLKSIPEPSA